MKYTFYPFLFLCLFSSCKQSKETATEQIAVEISDVEYRNIGDSITMKAQQTLVGQVTTAIAAGGAAHAVSFCSVHAVSITDSLSGAYSAKIQRIASKYRNAENAPKMALDSQLLDYFSTANLQHKDTIVHVGNSVLYYKPIRIGMPACLQCHGNSLIDVDAKTLALIKEKYPDDNAMGFKLGDFRGLWKITLKE